MSLETKLCTKCKNFKGITFFYMRSDKPHLYMSHCKECIITQNNSQAKNSNYAQRYYVKEKRKVARESNKKAISQYQAKWRKEKKELIKATRAKWEKENRAWCTAKNAKRRARKKQACPTWLTKAQHEEMKDMYKQAKELEAIFFNKKFHVDHIVPLQGKDVCGLHVPWNLQILTAEENAAKGNLF